jgi:hypothetical protein
VYYDGKFHGEHSVKCESLPNAAVSDRLKSAIAELRPLQKLLISEEVDPRVLSDFRDALNRVRNTAWATQQSIAADPSDGGTNDAVLLSAAERVRAAHHLCQTIVEDLTSGEVQFQRGQLSELHSAATILVERLKEKL